MGEGDRQAVIASSQRAAAVWAALFTVWQGERNQMANQKQSRVVGENGVRGTVLGPSDTSPDEIAIGLDDGREISVPPSALTLRPEGGWYLRTEDALGGWR